MPFRRPLAESQKSWSWFSVAGLEKPWALSSGAQRDPIRIDVGHSVCSLSMACQMIDWQSICARLSVSICSFANIKSAATFPQSCNERAPEPFGEPVRIFRYSPNGIRALVGREIANSNWLPVRSESIGSDGLPAGQAAAGLKITR